MAENFFHREKSGIDIILMEEIIHNMVSELKFFLCEETEQKKKRKKEIAQLINRRTRGKASNNYF